MWEQWQACAQNNTLVLGLHLGLWYENAKPEGSTKNSCLGQPASACPLLLSDSPPHVPAAELSTQQVIDVIANTTHTIREFFPTLPVYPAVGNHDYWPQVSPLLALLPQSSWKMAPGAFNIYLPNTK